MFNQQSSQLQEELSRKYAAIKGNKTFEMVVPLVPATGVSNHDSDPLTTARVHQAKANMDSVASAWLSALPTHPRAVMNNSAFDIAIRNRLLLDCLDDGEEAVTRACRGCITRTDCATCMSHLLTTPEEILVHCGPTLQTGPLQTQPFLRVGCP